MEEIYKINFSINQNLAVQNGFIINGNLKDEYQILQKKYYLLLEKFLFSTIKLNELEIELKNFGYFSSSKNYIKKRLNIEDTVSDYFFIRNNLNIEILTKDELNILKNSEDEQELYNMIKSSFLKVIKVNNLYGQKIVDSKILYDGTGFDFLKNNDSLVIGFIYNLEDNKIPDSLWEEYVAKRETKKEEIFMKIQKLMYDNFNCKVEFIEYYL